MPTPITWRNVNAQSQGDAARLLASGSNALTQGLSSIGQAAGQVNQNNLEANRVLTKANTDNLLATIDNFSAEELATAQNSGRLSPDNIQREYGGQVDVAAVRSALNNQDNILFDRSQESVLRKNTLATQEEAQYLRNLRTQRRGQEERQLAQADITNSQQFTDAQTTRAKTQKIEQDTKVFDNTIRDLQGSGASLNEQLENLEYIAQQNALDGNALEQAKAKLTSSLNQTRVSASEKQALDSQLATQDSTTDAQFTVLEQQHNALQASATPNSRLSADARAKQEVSLNKYLSEGVAASWFQDEDEKQQLIEYGEKVGASPAQMEAAASRVQAPSGAFNHSDYQRALDEIVKNPEGELLQKRIIASQNRLNAYRIGLPQKKATDRANLTQDFYRTLGIER